MTLADYTVNFTPFRVTCTDATMCATDLTLGENYEVVGSLQGYFIMRNDKGQLGKYYRDRFVLLEEEE